MRRTIDCGLIFNCKGLRTAAAAQVGLLRLMGLQAVVILITTGVFSAA